MKRYVGLIDGNNFFVSCERLFRPDLKHRPVVVLSSNDGCVVARSSEIKDRGIPMGVPYFQVKDILSHMGAAVFSSNFTLYRDISARVFGVVRRELGQIEQYSIDEAFFLVDRAVTLEKMNELKAVVEREVGIPVSIGLGFSRTQAKYANRLSKKSGGIYLLTQEAWEAHRSQVKLSEIWGVGPASARLFTEQGLSTVAEYLSLTRAQAHQLFGVIGECLWVELAAEGGSLLLGTRKIQQSIMSTRSFAKVTHDEMVVRAALLYHLQQVVVDLSSMQALATSVRVIAQPSRFSDYALQGIVRDIALPVPTRDIFTLTGYINSVLKDHFCKEVPYKRAGITVSVVPEATISGQLFTAETEIKTKVLTDLLVRLNERHGRNILKLGTLADQSATWSAQSNKLSPAYTTDWSNVCVVKA